VTPSQFLFDEAVFDTAYFADRMRESRRRKQRRAEEIRKILASSRSDTLQITDVPSIDDLPGLSAALDAFVGAGTTISLEEFTASTEFRMEDYRSRIRSLVERSCTRFSAIPPVCDDPKKDRARRFTTLVFMDHVQEVSLTQHGNDLLVNKHEADIEG